MAGGSRLCDNESAAAFPQQLQSEITERGYNDEQLYNCDETALFYKMLPDSTSVVYGNGAKSFAATRQLPRSSTRGNLAVT
nr:PREDICTED: tigger transposable element-derived protein 1-like [Latimeria chalumnae]|eukprot:XP_014347650.1 PREDICTED: tigger transposable element-derived protein 1-like [Latimeria chalumnae]